MNVFGIAGHSGMGKSTLLERLVSALTVRRGHSDSTTHSLRAVRAAAVACVCPVGAISLR
jgi:molybdopterin-guanine dinucleotide biosynthesis protein